MQTIVWMSPLLIKVKLKFAILNLLKNEKQYTVRFMKKSPVFAASAIQSGHRNRNPGPPTPICTAQR